MSAATVTVFVVFGPGAAFSQAAGTTAASEQHCQSFAYQQDAQAEWEKWGPNDPWRWDPDGDGVVCESKPSRPGTAAASGSGQDSPPDTPVSSEPGPGDGALPAGGSTGLGSPTSAPTTTAPNGTSEAPWSTETPWDGTHRWSSGEGGWQDDPRPVGGVQAGGGALAGDHDDGIPVLPLAGVAVGALLLTAGTKNRRRRSS